MPISINDICTQRINPKLTFVRKSIILSNTSSLSGSQSKLIHRSSIKFEFNINWLKVSSMSSRVSAATEGKFAFSLGVDGRSLSESCVELARGEPRREGRMCIRCDGSATGLEGVRRSIRNVRKSSNCSFKWGSSVVNSVESVRNADARICKLSDRISCKCCPSTVSK
jgi:hypothetical protein